MNFISTGLDPEHKPICLLNDTFSINLSFEAKHIDFLIVTDTNMHLIPSGLDLQDTEQLQLALRQRKPTVNHRSIF